MRVYIGKPTEALVSKLHRHKILVLGTATELEALDLVKVGVDGIVLQGKEAGGHEAPLNSHYQMTCLQQSNYLILQGIYSLPLIVAAE